MLQKERRSLRGFNWVCADLSPVSVCFLQAMVVSFSRSRLTSRLTHRPDN